MDVRHLNRLAPACFEQPVFPQGQTQVPGHLLLLSPIRSPVSWKVLHDDREHG